MIKKMGKRKVKRLLNTAIDDGLRKSIELVILAIIAGVAIKVIFIAVPAFVGARVISGSVIDRFLKN